VGALISTVVAVVVSVAVIGALFTGLNLAVDHLPQRWEDRLRPWVFVGPAVLFLSIALVVPTLRTVYLSLHEGRQGEGSWTLSNYTDTLSDDRVLSFANVGDIFTSWLFIAAVLMTVIAIGAAWLSSRKGLAARGSVDLSSPTSMLLLTIAAIAALMAVFSTLRGIIWNNLWWVVSVTGLSTVFGLALAVLADRSRNEKAAKTLIFMPMAISMVGAAIIWSYIYNLPVRGQSPGLLNEVIGWVGIEPIDFFRDPEIIPWNNFFIMIVMIWIQTGFAMVVLSAAIKAVPVEQLEAAEIDGTNAWERFTNVTLPGIRGSLVVVLTTISIATLKVFDIVRTMTAGNFDTSVIANEMYTQAFRAAEPGRGSALALVLFILVLPIVIYNVRVMRKQREIR
jgi:ABC-type sugar transport system permease subunit